MSIAPHAEERPATRERSGFLLRRVKIRNYKSIKSCDVELGPFTILVGRNGAGKSNFLDAIRLITEGLRGGAESGFWSLAPWIGNMTNGANSPDFEIQAEMDLVSGEEAAYSIRLGTRSLGHGVVVEESLSIRREGREVASYQCKEGRVVRSSVDFPPLAEVDRPYLSRASSVPEFRPVYDGLSSSAFYNLSPQAMREFSKPTGGILLNRDGANLAPIFYRQEVYASDWKDRLLPHLRLICPTLLGVHNWGFGAEPFAFLVFDCVNAPSGEVTSLSARGMSDGTLRALGILVAINQLANDGRPIRLVGIEEPETALHPAAVGALMDAFREAASHTQVLVTTHSADLLDEFDPETDRLLAVELREGRTEIGPVSRASRESIRERLYSAGELLRMDYFEPERAGDAPQPPTPSPEGDDRP